MVKKKNDFVKKVTKTAGKIQNNLVVSSITQGMMSTMCVLMGSAIINIIINLPIEAWKGLLDSIGLLTPLNEVVQLANCVGIFISFGIGKAISEKLGAKNPVQGGVLSLFSFLICTPIVANVTEAGTSYTMSLDLLGAQGVITAMIAGVVAGMLFSKLSKTKLVIKMPASVPPFVAQSFEDLPAFLFTIVPFIALRVIFGATSFGCFTSFVNTVLQIPLTMVGNSFAGHLVILAACSLLWWLGLHGTLIIMPALMVLCYTPLIENITAIASGGVAPNLLSMMTILLIVQAVGGPGCLFGLFIDMAIFTKSERYKTQGKLQLVPGLFNVIEPAVYGLPVVLNFTLLIPFVGLPIIVYTLMYICLKVGLFTTPITMASSFLPGPVLGFLAGGGLGLGIFIIVMCLLSCVVYYPFVKIMDGQALEEEKALAEAKVE